MFTAIDRFVLALPPFAHGMEAHSSCEARARGTVARAAPDIYILPWRR